MHPGHTALGCPREAQRHPRAGAVDRCCQTKLKRREVAEKRAWEALQQRRQRITLPRDTGQGLGDGRTLLWVTAKPQGGLSALPCCSNPHSVPVGAPQDQDEFQRGKEQLENVEGQVQGRSSASSRRQWVSPSPSMCHSSHQQGRGTSRGCQLGSAPQVMGTQDNNRAAIEQSTGLLTSREPTLLHLTSLCYLLLEETRVGFGGGSTGVGQVAEAGSSTDGDTAPQGRCIILWGPVEPPKPALTLQEGALNQWYIFWQT